MTATHINLSITIPEPEDVARVTAQFTEFMTSLEDGTNTNLSVTTLPDNPTA